MNQSSAVKVLAMWKIARSDPKFVDIGRRYNELEEAFSQLTLSMSNEEQDVMWGFVTTSDELDFRVMELMCEIFDIDPVGYLEQREVQSVGRGILDAPVVLQSKTTPP